MILPNKGELEEKQLFLNSVIKIHDERKKTLITILDLNGLTKLKYELRQVYNELLQNDLLEYEKDRLDEMLSQITNDEIIDSSEVVLSKIKTYFDERLSVINHMLGNYQKAGLQ